MSSSSSSDCENCDYCQCYSLDNNYDNCSYSNSYGRSIRSNRHVPFYHTSRHPLIYYAEVCQRPLNKRQRNDQPRKENQNCFIKAFKWYTQERVPPPEKDNCPDKCGFANWLDVKYVEYLRESRPCQNVYQLNPQATTTIEPCATSPSSNEPCTTKRFARMRSPWRKRRRPFKDSGDVPDKCTNQSCEFILQPKDLTRAASDCYPTPTSGCINKSNTTVVSSNVPGVSRCMGRSYSLTSITREISVQKHIDIIPCTVQEGSKTKETPKIAASCCREQIQQVPSKSQRMDVSCQCPEEKVIAVNAQTQYESIMLITTSNTETGVPCNYQARTTCNCYAPHTPVKIQSRKLSRPELRPKRSSSQNISQRQKKTKQSSISCQCPAENIVTVDTPTQYQNGFETCCDDTCRNVYVPDQDTQETKQVVGPKIIRRLSHNVINIDTTTCECMVKEVAPVCKCTRSLTCAANETVQTSDHSISFEGNCQYPLYMRIVCADRLNNE